jgi:hypothetical protein
MSPKPGGADDFLASGRGSDELAALERERLGIVVSQVGADYTVTWSEQKIACRFTQLHDIGRGVEGEVLITQRDAEIHWGRLTLNSTSKRQEIVRALKEKDPDNGPGWRLIVEQTCLLVTRAFRKGEPTVLLAARRRTGPRHAVWPLVEAEGVTLLYSDGGSGKGLVALLVAIASTTGRSLAGLRPMAPRPVLYLDWESSAADLGHRLSLLGAGLGIDTDGLIHYRRIVRPLADEVDLIRRDVAQLGGPLLLIVDSLGPASGGEPEGADAAIRTMTALRSLAVPALVLAHISGASTAMRGATRPYGSVFVWNLARSAWELKRDTEAAVHVVEVGCFHRKINEGVYQAPLGLAFAFDPVGDAATACHVGHVDHVALGQSPDLGDKLPLGRRLLAMLATAGKMTTEDLVEATGGQPAEVRARLGELRRRGLVVSLGGGGRGHQTLWALSTARESAP